MRLLWGLIWAASFALSLQEPRLLLFSPSVVHLGAPLSVGLQLQDAPRGQEVRGFLFLRNPSHHNAPCSPKVDFLLTSEQDFVLRSLQILPNGADSCGLKSLRGGPKIQLVAQSPWLKSALSKNVDTQGINLLFSSRRGHLFLQTDQPIYNPGQRVRYRVFALDQKMRPSTDSLTVTVENSQGLLVRKRQVYAPSSIFQDDFVIPDISEPGTWRISARFSDSPDSNHSTQFEVKKYVLPNFEVKIIPGEPYILTAAGVLGDIQLDIQARYIYGKPVQGVAYVRFGLLYENGDKTFLRGLENQTKVGRRVGWGGGGPRPSRAAGAECGPAQGLSAGEMLKLQLHTDSAALVALGAVDMALYAAGGKAHKPLDMGKVFEVMSSYDLGCGPGGGDSALQVFEAAGLAFSDGHRLTSTRNSLSCPKEQKTRKKRNFQFQKAISEKLGQYTSPVARRCCQDGLTRLPMTRSCEQRAARVPQLACREPFLSCCQFAEVLRKKTRARGQVGLARALEVLQEEDLMEEDDIPVRSFFPENWLWRVETVDRYLQLSQLPIPDSLTTWEIHGVSLSKTTGLCVATPVRLRVFRDFHLHLRLPISVRRFEQLELRPVLYNYLDTDLTLSVHVAPVDGLCLAGGGGLAQQVLVPAHSARPVGFSVVPTAAAAVSLKVVARGSMEFPVGDAVSKILKIEKEGAVHMEELVYELNPLDHRGRTLEIPGNSDPNIIPDGDHSSFVRVTASSPLDTLGSGGALSAGGVASLLRLPRGCGEQTMIFLAPTLAASRYLDKTEQWSRLPPETKDHAVDLIQKGYMRIQQFRKADGSYGAWLHRDSSTWLTAFVLKILSLAQEQVDDSPEKLQETAKWLLSQQQADGSFRDPCPVIHRGMQGGLVGSDETVALTAFVVIALHHGLAVFQDRSAEQLKQRVETSISNANSFLGAKASAGLLGAHAAAITAYALTLSKAPEDLRDVAHNNLMAMAQETGDKLYWGSVINSQSNVVSATPAPRSPADPVPQAPALWIETTAYGLLHLLLREGRAEMADQVASWLTHQGSFPRGNPAATQDTLIALDALEYWIASHTAEEGLNVTLSSQGRSGFKHVLQLNNHKAQGVQEELQFSLGSKINVKVGGNSKGTLKVLRTYNVLDMQNTTCQDLQIEVTVLGHVEYTMAAEEDYKDYYDYENQGDSETGFAGDDPGALSRPVTPLQLFEGRRSRRRREVPKAAEEQEARVQYTVCI
uniref:Anaphylatoxin-like domain-containing protein n=1 Tax=Myotis lucifugus TaxID=59463 RepID=G1P6M7_MYOLU